METLGTLELTGDDVAVDDPEPDEAERTEQPSAKRAMDAKIAMMTKVTRNGDDRSPAVTRPRCPLRFLPREAASAASGRTEEPLDVSASVAGATGASDRRSPLIEGLMEPLGCCLSAIPIRTSSGDGTRHPHAGLVPSPMPQSFGRCDGDTGDVRPTPPSFVRFELEMAMRMGGNPSSLPQNARRIVIIENDYSPESIPEMGDILERTIEDGLRYA